MGMDSRKLKRALVATVAAGVPSVAGLALAQASGQQVPVIGDDLYLLVVMAAVVLFAVVALRRWLDECRPVLNALPPSSPSVGSSSPVQSVRPPISQDPVQLHAGHEAPVIRASVGHVQSSAAPHRVGVAGVGKHTSRPSLPSVGSSSPDKLVRPYIPQGRGRIRPEREVAFIRSRVACTPTSAALLVSGIEGPTEHSLPRGMTIDGIEVANPVAFLVSHTVSAPGERLWVRDAHHAYRQHSKNLGLRAATMDQFGRAATILGWKRGKSSNRYFADRALKLDPPASPSVPSGSDQDSCPSSSA